MLLTMTLILGTISSCSLMSSLHLAASERSPEVLECLLRFTNDPDVSGCSCRTPLHCAAYEGDEDCVEILLRHGASLNWLDALEETALHKVSYLVAVMFIMVRRQDVDMKTS